MKMFRSKKFVLLMTLLLLVPLIWNRKTDVVYAATPSFAQSKIEIVGTGETKQLEIKNKVKDSKYKWSSSNKAVAKVSSKGVVTSVGSGTATIKCVITYPNKKTKTLSCKVTVTIPATDIKINNATEVNGAHIMTLGQTYTFNTTITPTNSSDKVFWYIGGGDKECIKINDNTKGSVTATKVGKVILVASAAKTATQAAADASIINDAIIIEVKGPSATVRSAEMVNSNEIKVVFDSPVNPNTVIGLNNKLTSNIEISQRKDVKGVLAKDPGNLTASLSADGQTLTIKSANAMSGEYGIHFTKGILTTSGVAIEEYYKQISFVDTFPPTIVETSYDDTGMIATIKFNEPIDFSNFKASNATLVATSGTSADLTTLSILNNTLNYVIAEDKQSVSINLSKISPSDYGKLFSVIFSGIKDMSGNAPASYTLTVLLKVDTSVKPQARVISVTRSGYNTITATFDRAIQYGGMISINNGGSINGVVDTKDSKKVHYTLTDSQAQMTGVQTVTIGYWSSYNADPADNYARQMHTFYVDFTGDRTNPVLLKYEYDPTTSVLTLTYSEPVTAKLSTGIFSARLLTSTDEIKPNTNITYTVMSHTEGDNILKLKMTNMTIIGTYTFNLEQGFAEDSFKNPTLQSGISISNSSGSAAELPRPLLITQSATNLSEIYVEFGNRLDVASAENKDNYSIAGVTILKAEVIKNTIDSGATVLLTVADGSIEATVPRPITIKGIKGYNNSFTEMSSYTVEVELKDNKRPYFIDPLQFDKNSRNTVLMKFSEPIQGNITVKVTQMPSSGSNSIAYEIPNTVTISGNVVYIGLSSTPLNNSLLKVEILTNDLKDTSGNAVVPISPMLYCSVQY